MKKLFVSLCIVLLASQLMAQPTFNLGVKGGVNFSKMSSDLKDYSSDAVVKSHIGAFARFGIGNVFIQPEAYYSGKGGDVTSDINNTVSSFDYSTIDVPVLLGFYLMNGEKFDLYALAGPVFSGITTKSIDKSAAFDKQFYKNHYFNVQYGLGIDFMFLTLGARFENGLNNAYKQQNGGFDFKNQNFMVSIGLKIL